MGGGGGGCCGCVPRCRTSWGVGEGAVVDVFLGVGHLGSGWGWGDVFQGVGHLGGGVGVGG